MQLTVEFDAAHGGRWTSLRTPEREWLWRNASAEAARRAARPGATFVDAGGVEECFPTVRGLPDHGDVWSRPWGERHGDLRLARRNRGGAPLTVDYTVMGPPHTPFVHAVHALLDVSPSARLEAPGATTAVLIDEGRTVDWPSGLDRLGPDDGTAVAAVLPGCAAATVHDGADTLQLAWRVLEGDAPCSLLLWRNLGGWPAGGPYRSIGVEPMVGTAAALDGPGEPASTGASGTLRWELTIAAG
ncbi:hypothetical protein [Pseudonocardia sp. GCM10023141]|uniref:hypothetical protein n=1 Tax=Pseudonocardia sp. GCM10023141 TaxID=3252653 RepID=UPI00361C81EF